jgi:Arc/MetJ family transcription regulator
MRITVDIDDNVLADVCRETGVEKKSPAVGKALEVFLKEIRKKRILALAKSGQIQFDLTNDEIEAGYLDDPD